MSFPRIAGSSALAVAAAGLTLAFAGTAHAAPTYIPKTLTGIQGGNDVINARDGQRDRRINCGPGNDGAKVDKVDPNPVSC